MMLLLPKWVLHGRQKWRGRQKKSRTCTRQKYGLGAFLEMTRITADTTWLTVAQPDLLVFFWLTECTTMELRLHPAVADSPIS